MIYYKTLKCLAIANNLRSQKKKQFVKTMFKIVLLLEMQSPKEHKTKKILTLVMQTQHTLVG